MCPFHTRVSINNPQIWRWVYMAVDHSLSFTTAVNSKRRFMVVNKSTTCWQICIHFMPYIHIYQISNSYPESMAIVRTNGSTFQVLKHPCMNMKVRSVALRVSEFCWVIGISPLSGKRDSSVREAREDVAQVASACQRKVKSRQYEVILGLKCWALRKLLD